MWQPNPADVVVLRDHGTGDMGSLAYVTGSDTNQKARFAIKGKRFVLVSVRCHFSGGSGDADCAINIDSGSGPVYDTVLNTTRDVGTDGTDMHFRVSPDEMCHWIFDGSKGDELVLTWTNPDSGNMSWGAEVFLLPIEE